MALDAGTAWGQVQYSMTNVGTLPGYTHSFYVAGLNNSGQVVGSAYSINGTYHGFLYSGGTMYDLGTLGGAAGEQLPAHAINNNGQVVGASIAGRGGGGYETSRPAFMGGAKRNQPNMFFSEKPLPSSPVVGRGLRELCGCV